MTILPSPAPFFLDHPPTDARATGLAGYNPTAGMEYALVAGID
ncbi:hypothetical protein [Sodalis sp. C49]